MTEKPSSADSLSPFWYAVGTLFSVPLLVIILLITSVAFLCSWPIVPILAYYQRKEELKDND
jgi:hypothetical protein